MKKLLFIALLICTNVSAKEISYNFGSKPTQKEKIQLCKKLMEDTGKNVIFTRTIKTKEGYRLVLSTEKIK